MYNSENDEKLFVLNNLELSTRLFEKENGTVSFICKKTNVSEVNDAKKFFMNKLLLSIVITQYGSDYAIQNYFDITENSNHCNFEYDYSDIIDFCYSEKKNIELL